MNLMRIVLVGLWLAACGKDAKTEGAPNNAPKNAGSRQVGDAAARRAYAARLPQEAAGWGYKLGNVRTRGADSEILVFEINDGEPVMTRDGKCDFNCGCSEDLLELVALGPVNMRAKEPDPVAARGFVSVECESPKGSRSRSVHTPGSDQWK